MHRQTVSENIDTELDSIAEELLHKFDDICERTGALSNDMLERVEVYFGPATRALYEIWIAETWDHL